MWSERTASDSASVQDHWEESVARLPSLFGRLLYLSSLRDRKSRRYYEHDLVRALGRQEADRVVRSAHLDQFREYLALSPQELKADLERYLAYLDVCTRTLLAVWSSQMPYSALIPDGVDSMERTLFLAGAGVAVALLRRELEHEGCQDQDLMTFVGGNSQRQPLGGGPFRA